MPGRKKKRHEGISSPKDIEHVSTSSTESDKSTRPRQSDDSGSQTEGESPSEGPSVEFTVATQHRPCNAIELEPQIFQPGVFYDQLAAFYAIASCFVPKLSSKVQTNISRGPPLLQDLYLALRRVMRRVEAGQTDHERSDVLTCSSGLQVLRDTRVHDRPSLVSFLWLGIFLKSFDRLVLGTSTHLICETTLLQLRNWYPSVSRDPEMMDPIVCLLFTDTVTCLVNRQIPMIKFEPPKPGMVDRYAGLCCGLLPLLYDACEIVAAGKLGDEPFDTAGWDRVYQHVEPWEPQCSPDMLGSFTPDELTVLLTQAHAYRLATLLILNTARYSTDADTNTQGKYADEILSQMETCLLVVGEPPPHTVLPIFVAAMELTDHARRSDALRVLGFCRGAKYYPYMTRLNGMCHQFWNQKDTGGSSDWLTYLERYHPLNIPL